MKNMIRKAIAIIAISLLAAGQAYAAATVTYYHHDALGSVVASSHEGGWTNWNEEYQPYGEKIYDTVDNEGGSDEFYTGKNYNSDIDLTYFGARWYDAKQGRFLSMDPAPVNLNDPHTFNRYHYANSNPYKYVDPDGRAVISLTVIALVAISAALTTDNAIDSYNQHASVTNQGISTDGLAAAGKSVAIDGAITVGTLGVGTGAKLLYGASKGIKNVPNPGGRLGSQSTRDHIGSVATEMERRGFTITGGGNRLPEEYLPGLGGGRKGSSFVDITGTKSGRTVRVNTIDTRVNGITPTTREATNAARIRSQTPGDHLLLVPKP